LPGASKPADGAETLLHHLLTPKPLPPPLFRLVRHEDYTLLTSDVISRALSPSLNTSALGPDHIQYSVWKSVHPLKPYLLPSLLDPMLANGFHTPSLKKALGIILDKQGKRSYDSPSSSFRVIVLLRTLSKILERVVTSRLSAQATTCSLIHPHQCWSLPRRSTADAALDLQHNVESFDRLHYKVSTLFLNVKGGFDNVESPSRLSLLRRHGVSPYLVQWLGSFRRHHTCHQTLQGSPRLFAPISVGVPQASPMSPLLFVIYVSSLQVELPKSLIISYVDNFAVTVASPSYRTNVPLLLKSLLSPKRKASPINMFFSVPKTKLIHWRTARSNEPPCSLLLQLDDQLFYPQSHLKWLGFIFTLSFDPRAHSPGGTPSQMPFWQQLATSPPPGWAFPPTSVSPWRVRSWHQFSSTGLLFGAPPQLS